MSEALKKKKKKRQSCSPMMPKSQWSHLLHSFISLYC